MNQSSSLTFVNIVSLLFMIVDVLDIMVNFNNVKRTEAFCQLPDDMKRYFKNKMMEAAKKIKS